MSFALYPIRPRYAYSGGLSACETYDQACRQPNGPRKAYVSGALGKSWVRIDNPPPCTQTKLLSPRASSAPSFRSSHPQ